jgi:pheromone shutdown-related protein TraB
MKIFRNITILGTSHIAGDSVKEAKSYIENNRPDIVAVELDAGRAYSLKNKQKKPKGITVLKSLGLSGYLFYVIGQFIQSRLGKIVDIEPGSDMLAAMQTARKEQLIVAFIDRDIRITLGRFSRYFKKREVLRMITDMVFGRFGKSHKFDISKVPPEELIDKVIAFTKKRYPSLYKVLVDERDHFMAARLFELSRLQPEKKIFAVVGAGHVRGILRYLARYYEGL